MIIREYKIVPKSWGKEVWICNNRKYCGKFLYLNKGKNCSMHKHSKDEVLYLLKGKLHFKLRNQLFILNSHDSIRVKPNTFHQFKALKTSVIIEFSTPHKDIDVVRKYREWE